MRHDFIKIDNIYRPINDYLSSYINGGGKTHEKF